MLVVLLTRGKAALIDDEDGDLVHSRSWCASDNGLGVFYAQGTQGERRVFMHRLIMGEPDCDVDHVNRNTLDNRRSNLRLATRSQNLANKAKQPGGTSQYKGVSWMKAAGKWQASIRVEGKSRGLGLFTDETAAARAYDEAATDAWGEYARVNFGG